MWGLCGARARHRVKLNKFKVPPQSGVPLPPARVTMSAQGHGAFTVPLSQFEFVHLVLHFI